MIRAEDVVTIYQSLLAGGIEVWLTGGWGIDALLQEQTRPHKDIDVLVLVDDVAPMCELLGRAGYGLNELWAENAWAVDSRGRKVATAFVLQDPAGREIDVHALRLDGRFDGIPAWMEEGLVLRREDLAGQGRIAGSEVRCISAEMQAVTHSGYDLPCEQLRDLALLHERFGIDTWGQIPPT